MKVSCRFVTNIKMSFNSDSMKGEITLCSHCGQGTLYLEEIADFPNGEHIETRYYSCGHKHEDIEISTEIGVESLIKKIVPRGGDKIGTKKNKKKQEYEIEERYKNNDRDRPGTPTVELVYKNHRTNPTSVFHIAKYLESNKLKHVDCKTCDNDMSCRNEWRFDFGSLIEGHFAFEHTSQ